MTLPFSAVVEQLMLATGCDRAKAEAAARKNGFVPPAPDPAAERNVNALEKAEQLEVVKLFRAFGFKVRNTSQARRSKVAAGIPDLICMHRELPIAFWWETKRQVGGRFSADQIEFRDDCLRCHVGYGAGDRHAARTHLIHLGLACVINGVLEPIHHHDPVREDRACRSSARSL